MTGNTPARPWALWLGIWFTAQQEKKQMEAEAS
jgi:hypothetical protein